VHGSAPVIEYDGAFTFPVPVARVWEMMGRFALFPSWWSWLREFSVEGQGLERGTVLHGIVAPPLPYRMQLDVVLDDCDPGRRIAAFVHGDLEGTATLTFDGDDTEARVHATWTIEMMQRPMRMAARFAYPLLRWGHDRVVDATVDGFRRHLVGELAG
jgi:Polyketide cyclase / dehydrase and lipid transport